MISVRLFRLLPMRGRFRVRGRTETPMRFPSTFARAWERLLSLRAPGVLLFALWAGLVPGTLPGFSNRAMAHQIQPAVADLSFDGTGGYRISIVLNLEAIMSAIDPELADTSQSTNAAEYDRLRALPPEELARAFRSFSARFLDGIHVRVDGTPVRPEIRNVLVPEIGDLDFSRESVVVLGGTLPENAKTLSWGWAFDFGPSILRVSAETDDDPYSAYLEGGEQSEDIPVSGKLTRSLVETIVNYMTVGYIHIVPRGLDHILFVVGLFLLSTRLHPLLWQITAFTVAHSISLALGITGIVRISPAIVEPLIALSIVYVCVENLFTRTLTRWRPVIVFCFGLLHGLGFAGILMETGLPRDQFVTALISFNVGVELGQISVIAVCFLLVGIWFSRKSWYRRGIAVPGSLVIATIATWWFFERIFFV